MAVLVTHGLTRPNTIGTDMACGWFYNDVSGVVRYDCGVSYVADLASTHLHIGWHGPYKTQAEAMTHPGVTGEAATTNTNPINAAANIATGSLIPALFTSRALWVRIVEVALGGTLILVGLSKLLEKPALDIAKMGLVK